MAKTNNNSGEHSYMNKQTVLIGSVVAAAALTAYFAGTDRGRKQAKKMKGWMVQMQGEVLEKLENVRDVTEPVYHEVVDTVASAQAAAGKIPKNEIMALAMHLKRQWEIIQRMTGKKGGKKTAKKGGASRSARSTGRKTSQGTSPSKKRSAKKSGKSRSAKR